MKKALINQIQTEMSGELNNAQSKQLIIFAESFPVFLPGWKMKIIFLKVLSAVSIKLRLQNR